MEQGFVLLGSLRVGVSYRLLMLYGALHLVKFERKARPYCVDRQEPF